MLRHYIKTTLRGIRFHPFDSFISILGLSIGLASCMLIFSYWAFEQSFDNFHIDSKKTLRVYQEKILESEGSSFSVSTFSKVGQELRSSSSAVESVLRIHRSGQNRSIQANGNIITQEGIIGAEATFFDFFDFKFIKASAEQLKSTPQSVILTKSLCDKLFDKADPMGQSIIINGVYEVYQSSGSQEFKNYTVAGITEDLPSNTHLDFSTLISLNLHPKRDQEFSNLGDQLYTYVKIESFE